MTDDINCLKKGITDLSSEAKKETIKKLISQVPGENQRFFDSLRKF